MELEKAVSVNLGNIGLANVIWKIASAYGIAIKRNAKCYLGENQKPWQDISGFCGPFPKLKPNNLPAEHYISEKYPGTFEKKMFEYDIDNKHIRVGTYLQSRKYFAHCEKEVIKMFQPKQEYISKANKWFKKHGINDNDIKVCIHIRGGDMNKEPQTLPDNNWFIEAISKMPSNAKIIIFSDDFNLVRSFSAFLNKKYIFAEKNSIMLDFTLMTCCNNFILSRGTFSWWAAFLSKNKNKVIYHDEFLNTELENHYPEYYPDDWILIDFKYSDVSCIIENKPKISVEDSYDLVNYYYYTIKNRNIDIKYISKLCNQANKTWNFHITHIEGNFKPTSLSEWTLSINKTKKLVLVLSLDNSSLLFLKRETVTKIPMEKNQLYIFPAYIVYRCFNVALFYALGDTFV
tara:strand:+ start:187 stop:1395 length:1209 start_codon:yes stop_codon:yes gene_type:complete